MANLEFIFPTPDGKKKEARWTYIQRRKLMLTPTLDVQQCTMYRFCSTPIKTEVISHCCVHFESWTGGTLFCTVHHIRIAGVPFSVRRAPVSALEAMCEYTLEA
jgi:hypothetical protein